MPSISPQTQWNPGFGSSWIGTNPPPPPPPPPRERLHIEGTRIMLGNREWVGRGMVCGHGELYRTGDAAFLAARKANIARRGNRWWGNYGPGYQRDSELDADPGHIDEDYFRDIVSKPIDESYDAGQRNLLFMDSNCGQGIPGEVCKLDGINNMDFFTDSPLARAKFLKYLDAGRYILQQKKGRVDKVEPLVEPAGNSDQRKLWNLYQEAMEAYLDVDPAILFVLGGTPNYQPNKIDQAYNPDWARGRFKDKIILTGNLLSGIVKDPALRASRLKYMTDARAHWKVPVFGQQTGSMYGDDPTNVHLDAMLTMLDNADGGPIGYTGWEEFSVFKDSPERYGFWALANPNDPNGARIQDDARLQVWANHFALND